MDFRNEGYKSLASRKLHSRSSCCVSTPEVIQQMLNNALDLIKINDRKLMDCLVHAEAICSWKAILVGPGCDYLPHIQKELEVVFRELLGFYRS